METGMNITIAIQCAHFQRRLCWMLSSLLQQSRPHTIVVDIAGPVDEGGDSPTNLEVASLFRGPLDIRTSMFADKAEFQARGLVRNRQIQECTTEWMLFGDCDMVYHPLYFESLLDTLKTLHPNATYMVSAGRTSNPKDLTNAMVDAEIPFPKIVENAFEKADKLPKKSMRNCGAGHSQIINMRHAPHKGYYVTPAENRDWDWEKGGSNPKSDMQFRRRIEQDGGKRQKLCQWFADNAIHLNHNRDPEVGKHTEEQR